MIETMHKRNTRGFTIVDLLIVIVVIAILAAITIVAFNGIQQRARNTQMAAAEVKRSVSCIGHPGVKCTTSYAVRTRRVHQAARQVLGIARPLCVHWL